MMAYILYYNYQKPWQLIEEKYKVNPERFILNTNHKITGLNN
jgi:hypothetical protein